MKLSIVIVNFNVVYYLEQCLKSVEKALEGIDSEVFVVDNNSVDGSCQMLRTEFPWVHLIENDSNLGFSKANNQAILLATGQYLLLLNPDTVVEKDCFSQIINYMDENPNVGGLGVKMIDGNGVYLPESKRGFPSPKVAFFKMSGLSKLFPKSKLFNWYHLGHLNKDEINEVEVLSGAFMLVRKSVLDTVGMLDETYFMYGEDIDLSYRIVKAGYKNIYFPQTTIIHYKGKSTQKGSLNYVVLFYSAMKIFAKKFFSKSHAQTFMLFINLAIYLRAGISLLRRIFVKLLYPFFDFLILYAGFALFTPFWGRYKYQNQAYDFPEMYYHFNIPLYGAILIATLYITGTYVRPIEMRKTIKYTLIAMFINLALFAFLPESARFSRAMFLVGTIFVLACIPIIRYFLSIFDNVDFELKSTKKRRTLIVGSEYECRRVSEVISKSIEQGEIVGYISPGKNENPFFIGNLSQLKNCIKIHQIQDVVFCENDLSESIIIQSMISISSKYTECKIAAQKSHFIIGNNISNLYSELYTVSVNSIASPQNLFLKRLFDIIFSFKLLLLSPLLLLFFRVRIIFIIRNSFAVIKSEKTWVGYNSLNEIDNVLLPQIKKCIIPIAYFETDPEKTKRLNILYAKNYSIIQDAIIIIKNFNLLSN